MRWSLPPLAAGLAVAAAGLATKRRAVALAGLGGLGLGSFVPLAVVALVAATRISR